MSKLFILLLAVSGLVASAAAAAASAPVNTAAPSISGTVRQGESLTADAGTWSGSQPISFAYQWRRCDNAGVNCADIGNATTKTYTASSADVGNTLRVRVTATNSVGSSATASAATAIVSGLPKEAVNLDINRGLVIYGGLVRLSGSVANGKPGETVTIMEHTVPFGHLAPARQAASLELDAEGASGVSLEPRIHTVYVAETSSGDLSNPVAVNVRPWLPLSHAGLHRYLLRAIAARSFVGKYAIVERWRRSAQVWVAPRRVYLNRALVAGSPTIVSLARFRLPLSGVTLRALIPLSQTVPGYVSGSSNGLTAH